MADAVLGVYGLNNGRYDALSMQAMRGLDGSVISCSAPGRAGIIGNPTDMYGGSVISCSLRERAYCDILPSDHLEIRMGSYALEVTDEEDLELTGDQLDLARVVLSALEMDVTSEKFLMELRTNVPEQAGLAGSTAMLASIVGALLSYMGLQLNRYEIAEMVKRIEYKVLGLMCGYQDHYMAVFGGLNFMDFHGKEEMEQAPDEPLATIEPLDEVITELPMILAHTGVKRNSGKVHRSLRERWLDRKPAVVEGYERIADLARLGKKALILQDWEELGRLMNENHTIQRDLGGSGESNEILINAALENGAYGAKLAGAGQGGTIIMLTDNPYRMTEALLQAGAERVFGLGPSEGLISERRL